MKLYYSKASPYARKVIVTAMECGLEDQLELVESAPLTAEDPVHLINPLGRVPALVSDEGQVLFDSPVICEYLDSLAQAPHPLLPPSGPRRWSTLRRQALGDGIADSAVPWRLELLRPESERSQEWLTRRRQQIRATLAYLPTLESEWQEIDLGNLSIACGLGYLLFRFPEEGWREQFPRVFDWYDVLSSRDSLRRTQPS